MKVKINTYISSLCGCLIASFPGLPRLCSLVCIQYNTRKWKSGEKQGRPGNTYHMNDIWWTQGGCRGGYKMIIRSPIIMHNHEWITQVVTCNWWLKLGMTWWAWRTCSTQADGITSVHSSNHRGHSILHNMQDDVPTGLHVIFKIDHVQSFL